MALVHRKLLLAIEICSTQNCYSPCNCQNLPPLPYQDVPLPPPPPEHHRLVPISMSTVATMLGAFFFVGIICLVARLYYLRHIESRRRRFDPPILFHTHDGDFADEDQGPAADLHLHHHHPIWLINFVGLQQSVIDSITVCKYKRGEGLIEGTECSVCLSEFEEDESLRLLPKCSHAFHLPCIDTWLRSHKNCPLCRAPVVSNTGIGHAGQAEIDLNESREETQMEVSENDLGLGLESDRIGEDGATSSEIGGNGDVGFGSATPIDDQIRRNEKICDSRALSDLADNRRMMVVEEEEEVQPMRRSVSMDSPSATMIYLAVANANKRQGNSDSGLKRSGFKNFGSGSGSSSSLYRMMKSSSFGFGRDLRKGPVSMKRSSSSRYCCRSQDSILPL